MNSSGLEDSYLALVKDNRIVDSSLHESASVISRHCALAISASRASVWMSQGDNSVFHCLSLYSADKDTNESGAVLEEKYFPRYFKALAVERVIDAHRAMYDSRTSELTESYLKPLDVHSLLDSTIRHRGNVVGVLCIEMVSEERYWSKEEQAFVTSVADFISQRIIADELMRSEETYKALFDHTSEGIIVLSDGKCADINPALCSMFRGTRDDLIGKSPVELSPLYQPDGQPSVDVAMGYISKCLQGEPQNFEWVHQRLDGTQFHADIALNAVRLAGEDTVFALIRDITERKDAEEKAIIAQEKLAWRATHDPLTSLLVRDQLHVYFDEMIKNKAANECQESIALMLLDLNRFKEVNDTLGHATGDGVLIKLSSILIQQINELGGYLFRLGGDEFVALFDCARCDEPVGDIAVRLHQCVKTSIDLDDIKIEMSASIGIAVYPENGKDSHELLRCADVAMYNAKNNDGVTSRYDLQNDMNNKRRLSMMVELGAGISENQLILHFQPRIHLKTGQVTGCEALVRWHHPKLGLVPPNEFLPLAEMTELIHPLSEWVLNNSVSQIKRSLANGCPVPVAMNISARNLTDSQLVDKLEILIAKENIDPQLLEIELTESALINHPQRAVENLKKLDELGVHIAIDDFGTGYSSLSYLKKLPLNTLKIDRSFVKDMLTDASDSVIVDSTIALAHNFSLTVVAEGVEDQATLDELAARGCDQAQGFFIGKPMPIDEFEAWLDNYHNPSLRLAS